MGSLVPRWRYCATVPGTWGSGGDGCHRCGRHRRGSRRLALLAHALAQRPEHHHLRGCRQAVAHGRVESGDLLDQPAGLGDVELRVADHHALAAGELGREEAPASSLECTVGGVDGDHAVVVAHGHRALGADQRQIDAPVEGLLVALGLGDLGVATLDQALAERLGVDHDRGQLLGRGASAADDAQLAQAAGRSAPSAGDRRA